MTRFGVLLALILSSTAFGRVPDIEDLIGLEAIGEARISPDGEWIAYTVTAADFDEDAYVRQIWLVDLAGNRFPLTRGAKSSTRPRWSPDGKWLAFVSSRHEDVAQIFAIRPRGGEALRLTDSEGGVTNYVWSTDGGRIAYIATERESADSKSREKHMGGFHVVRREYKHRHLWTIDVTEAIGEPSAGEQHTRGEDFSIRNLSFSPDGGRIAVSATINPDLIHGGTADIYVVTLSDNSIKRIVSQPGPDSSPLWSPDGSRIVFSASMGREPFDALNNELAVVSAEGGDIRVLTEDFDERPRLVEWNHDGICFSAFQKTARHLFRINTSTLRSRASPSRRDSWRARSL